MRGCAPTDTEEPQGTEFAAIRQDDRAGHAFQYEPAVGTADAIGLAAGTATQGQGLDDRPYRRNGR